MTTFTPRQRVCASLDHREPDRVPLDLGTGGNTSLVPEAYARLAAHYGISTPPRLLTHTLRLAGIDESILEDLEIDTRPVYMQPARHGRRQVPEPGCFCDDFGVVWREVDAGTTVYREIAESPLASATVADLDAYPWWPDPHDPDRYVGVREEAERLYNQTDYAVVGCPGFNGIWERAWYLCGFERFLSALVTDRDFVHAVLRRITDICIAALTRFLEDAGPYIQMIKLGDDLGGQQGPLMSPRTYHSVIAPYHKEICTAIRRHTGARIFLHTCGSVYRLLPDLIDAGFEVLNPVQVSAAEMDTARLKAEYGRQLSFLGAIDTQQVLPFGTPDDVRREVELRLRDLGLGGGYIVAPVHNVQADVPPENLIAMYRHACQAGRYPLACR